MKPTRDWMENALIAAFLVVILAFVVFLTTQPQISSVFGAPIGPSCGPDDDPLLDRCHIPELRGSYGGHR